jgi:hypothetical protein
MVARSLGLAVVVGCVFGCTSSDGEAIVVAEPALTGVSAHNDDPDSIILWSQNVAQFGHGSDGGSAEPILDGFHWKNIIRCVRDPECNRFNVLPDVFVLQEASGEMCELFENELERQLDGGANTWDWWATDNYTSWSYHWLSGCVIYRRARFDSPSRIGAKIPMYETNNPAPCAIGNRSTPVLKIKDTKRAASKPDHWLTIASFHEDHFGPYDTCDDAKMRPDGSVTSSDPNKFCDYLNMKKLGAEMPKGDLEIVAGDFNYAPYNCNDEKYYRCHYKAIVNGLGTCGDKTNLGWQDPFLAESQSLIQGYGQIDWILTRGGSRTELLPSSARNYKMGIAGACFYCNGSPNAYAGGSPEIEKERITDHHAKFVRVFY